MHFVVAFDRLEMADDLQAVRERLVHRLLDQRRALVGLGDRDVVGEEEVKLDQEPVSRVPVPQAVELDLKSAGLDVKDRFQGLLGFRIDLIHEALDGATEEVSARPEDIRSHDDRKNRIEREPASRENQEEADDHAEARPAVGEDMLAVRFENDGVVLSPLAYQVPAQSSVDSRGDDDKDRPGVEIPDRETG